MCDFQAQSFSWIKRNDFWEMNPLWRPVSHIQHGHVGFWQWQTVLFLHGIAAALEIKFWVTASIFFYNSYELENDKLILIKYILKLLFSTGLPSIFSQKTIVLWIMFIWILLFSHSVYCYILGKYAILKNLKPISWTNGSLAQIGLCLGVLCVVKGDGVSSQLVKNNIKSIKHVKTSTKHDKHTRKSTGVKMALNWTKMPEHNKTKLKRKMSNAKLNLELMLHHISFYSIEHSNKSHTILLSLWTQWPFRGILISHC